MIHSELSISRCQNIDMIHVIGAIRQYCQHTHCFSPAIELRDNADLRFSFPDSFYDAVIDGCNAGIHALYCYARRCRVGRTDRRIQYESAADMKRLA